MKSRPLRQSWTDLGPQGLPLYYLDDQMITIAYTTTAAATIKRAKKKNYHQLYLIQPNSATTACLPILVCSNGVSGLEPGGIKSSESPAGFARYSQH